MLFKEDEGHPVYETLLHSIAQFLTCGCRASWILLEWKKKKKNQNTCFGKNPNIFVLHCIKIPLSIPMKHCMYLVLWFLSQLVTGKHLYHFCFYTLSFTFLEYRRRVLSAWVSWEAILFMTFFSGNLCFCPWSSEQLQDKILAPIILSS